MGNIPYTYLIGWSEFNKWYYGVRFSKTCRPSDLWVTYFTSSKHVKSFREKFGEPDILEIRKTFKTSKAARDWEKRVLIKMEVTDDDRWLNQTNNISISSESCSKASKNKSFYNNGIKEIRCIVGEEPDSFIKGRLIIHSKENKLKMGRKSHKTLAENKKANPEKYKALDAENSRKAVEARKRNIKANPEKYAEIYKQSGLKAYHTALERGTLDISHISDPEVNRETAIRRMGNGTNPFGMKSICPHCGKEGQTSAMKRWHFDNCKIVLDTFQV